ncbi:MAG: class I SAM-dependent methyltransferase [Pseudomonadota bacterium]
MSESNEHWENIYKTRDHKQVGWYQESPKISLELLSRIKATPAQSLIDVGCGASVLVDNLILQGYRYLTLLDISKHALATIRTRLGDKGNIPLYLSKNITQKIEFNKLFDIWHDRAVFHFLTDNKDRSVYMANLEHSLLASGHAIIGTFSLNGPNKCSGLDIVQYDKEKMQLELPRGLRIIDTTINKHIMPNGKQQEYMYFIISKKSK